MRIRHRIIAVLAVICMVGAVIIGSKFEMTGASEDLTGLSLFEKKETIYFWYSEEALTDFINSAAVAFGEKRNVRVIPQLVSESEYIEAINEATLYSDQGPDAYLISHDSLEKAYLAGLAGEVLDEGGILSSEQFPQAALSAVTYHNKLVAYPFYFDTTVLVYNQSYLEIWMQQQAEKALEETEELDDMDENGDAGDGENDLNGDGTQNGEDGGDATQAVDEEALALEKERIDALLFSGIPQTVDDILYIGDTFDAPDDVEGIMKWDVSDIFYNYWIVGNYMIVGGDTGDNKTDVNIDNEQTLKCLEIYKALNQFFYIESDTVTYDSVVQDFIDGKIVFTIAATDVVKKLEEAKEDGTLVYKYGITVMPDMGDRLKSRAMSVTNAVAVNGYSGHRALADEFAAFLTGEYSQNLYARTGKIAAYKQASIGDAFLQTFLQEYEDSIPLPKMIATSNLWIQMEVLFSKVWNGEEVEALLKELSNQIQIQLGNAIG